MRKSIWALLVLAAMATVFISCSREKKPAAELNAAEFLPIGADSSGFVRSSQIKTYIGDTLWEYIDGGAELYHQYNFVMVATADYKAGSVEMVADVYQFDSPTDAYGLYCTLRPSKPGLVRLGVEGFSAPQSLIFVKGPYLVRLLAFEETEASNKALASLGQELDRIIPGDVRRPNAFILFPINNLLGSSDKYFAQSFLGQKFLPRCFSQDYLLDTDTVTLFMTTDDSGEKYLKWSELAASMKSIEPIPDSLSYDSARAFMYNDSFNGRIVAGLKKGKLLGMVKYSDTHKQFLADWLNSFQ